MENKLSIINISKESYLIMVLLKISENGVFMKKIVITKKERIKELKNYTDAFLFGIKGLSVNVLDPISLSDLKILLEKYPEKEFFVSLNKNIHNEDLPFLRKTLEELNKLPIKGILFYDTSIVRIKKEENFSFPLFWAAEHLTTNFNTIHFFEKKGVNGAFVSSDITLREILEIRKNTTGMLMVAIFGYQSMMVSRRHLLNNYLNAFQLKNSSKNFFLQKEGKRYSIFDTKEGTFVYSSNVLNAITEFEIFEKEKIDYALLDSTQIEETIFLNIMKQLKKKNYIEVEKIIKEKIPNQDKGFLYQETIYKVKG